MAHNLYALLIGINRYAAPGVPPLRGCVRDAQGVYALLVDRLGVPAENVKLLLGEEATRANILNGWRDHLWAKAAVGDQLFFHFSGHGSQARSVDPAELDGYDETLVAYDSRTPGQYDILDKELAQLIGEAEQKQAQVTLLLDCCHSGSGTRAGGDNRPLARQCGRDLRPRPLDTLVAARNLPLGAPDASNHWLPATSSSPHVLLAACRDEELANEYRAPTGGSWQGALTYFFLQAMQQYHPEMTWAALYDLIYPRVRAAYPTQSPQLEGPRHVQVFGGAGQENVGYLLVLATNANQIKISGGAAVGLQPGGRVAIYPPASPCIGQPAAVATVDEVMVDAAWASLDRSVPVEVSSRVKLVAFGEGNWQHAVGVADPLVCERIALANNGQPSAFLTIVAPLDSSWTPEFFVTVVDHHYTIEDATGTQLISETPAVTPEGATQVVNILEHLAIYRNVQQLRNTAVDPALRGAIIISEPTASGADAGGNLTNPTPIRQPGGELVAVAGRKITFTVQNKAKEPIYLTVLRLQADWRIQRIFPVRTWSDKLAPGRSTLPISVRLNAPDQAQPQGTEIFKIFATTIATSFDVLQLPALQQGDIHGGPTARTDSGLGRLLNAVRHTGTRVFQTFGADATDDQWITAQLEIKVLMERH